MKKTLLLLLTLILAFALVSCDSESMMGKITETMGKLGQNVYGDKIQPNTEAADEVLDVVTTQAVVKDESGAVTSITLTTETRASLVSAVAAAKNSEQTTAKLVESFKAPVEEAVKPMLTATVASLNTNLATAGLAISLTLPEEPKVADLVVVQLATSVATDLGTLQTFLADTEKTETEKAAKKAEVISNALDAVNVINLTTKAGAIDILEGVDINSLIASFDRSAKGTIPAEYVQSVQNTIDMLIEAIGVDEEGNIDSDGYKAFVVAMSAKRLAYETASLVINPVVSPVNLPQWLGSALLAQPGKYDVSSLIDYVLAVAFSEADFLTKTATGNASASFIDVLQEFLDDNEDSLEDLENEIDDSSFDGIVEWLQVEANWKGYVAQRLGNGLNTVAIMIGDCAIDKLTSSFSELLTSLQ